MKHISRFEMVNRIDREWKFEKPYNGPKSANRPKMDEEDNHNKKKIGNEMKKWNRKRER